MKMTPQQDWIVSSLLSGQNIFIQCAGCQLWIRACVQKFLRGRTHRIGKQELATCEKWKRSMLGILHAQERQKHLCLGEGRNSTWEKGFTGILFEQSDFLQAL